MRSQEAKAQRLPHEAYKMNMRKSVALGDGSVRRPPRKRGLKGGAGVGQAMRGPSVYSRPASLQALAYSAVQMSATV